MTIMRASSLTVESLSNKGLGLVKIDQRPFLVEGVYPQDKITVDYDDQAAPYSEIRLVAIDSPSPHRVQPFCEHFGHCRGCTLMALDYSEQLKLKTEKLKHLLEKNHLDTSVVKPILASPQTRGYRNRGQFKVSETQIGYADKYGKQILPITSCPILNQDGQAFLADLLKTLPNENLAPGQGFSWNFIDFDSRTTLTNFTLNQRLPFSQGNDGANLLMKKWLEEKLITAAPGKKVVEFFCGSGNFTEVIAHSKAADILAIEVQGSALEELKAKQLPRVKIREENLFQSNVWKKIAEELEKAQVWVLDPPRSGLNYQRAWIKSMPELTDIFYISCDPASFSRDCAQFVKMGFELIEVQPLDQFPHTIHFEVLGHLKSSAFLSQHS